MGYMRDMVVSILTGLERPVQRTCVSRLEGTSRFQSSPALKDRCNRAAALYFVVCPSFNPHRP